MEANTLSAIISVVNIGAALTLLGAAGKLIWYLSKLDSRTEKNTGDINAAFSKIRDIELSLKK